jgi:hypothetical protein
MFHKTALIIIAFFAISSLLSLHLHHMTSLATLSFALSCISACISPYLPPILSSPLSSPPPSFPAISFPHLHIYLPSHPFHLPQNLYALAIQSISNIFHPLSYLLPLPSQPRQKHLPLISIRTFYPHSQNHPLTFPLSQNKNDLAMCLHLLPQPPRYHPIKQYEP